MTNNEISSISDLLRILTELGEAAEGHTRFFRGQGKADWEILPGIYRNQRLVENEDKIIKEALLNCPDDFSPADTLLEKLVKLQHYGYPTRLLDLTANALVGLYFSCSNESHNDKNGELIILDIPNDYVKYDDSDRVAILSSISLSNSQFNVSNAYEQSFRNLMISGVNHSKDLQKTIDDIHDVFEDHLETLTSTLDDRTLNRDEIIEELKEKFYEELLLKEFNKNNDIISLLHIIQHDKPSFRPVINYSDFNQVLCVKVKLNNSRISRQQGAFLIFGIDKSKLIPAQIPNIWQRKIGDNKIIVKANSKANILKELKTFGISKQILFPELESQASEIIAQYKNQLKRN